MQNKNNIPNVLDKGRNNPNVPTLRFSEYHINWTLSLLKNLCKMVGGGTPNTQTNDFWNGTIPWISSSDIYEDSIYKINKTRFITTDAILKSATKKCPKNTIHIVSRVGLGKIAISSEEICTSQDFTNIIEYSLEKYFLAYCLKKVLQKKISESQGTSIKGITSKEIANLNIYYPSKEEQIKIANFLTLIDQRIETQSKIISALESQMKAIRAHIYNSIKNYLWTKLYILEEKGIVSLKRGNVIPKHEYDDEHCYPVYSSSVHNNGLMGYSNNFMFDKELITWSVDGGGDFFYREKHKFNVTNVSGILELDTSMYDYYFVAEMLQHQHSKLVFDYQTKAHPSVINKLYSLPEISLNKQKDVVKVLKKINFKLQIERDILNCYKQQKAYLLANMLI